MTIADGGGVTFDENATFAGATFANNVAMGGNLEMNYDEAAADSTIWWDGANNHSYIGHDHSANAIIMGVDSASLGSGISYSIRGSGYHYAAQSFTGNFTSKVDMSSVLIGSSFSHDLTAVADTTLYQTHIIMGASAGATITTQNQSQTISRVVSTLYLDEPGITIGNDTTTNAATLFIEEAPTEGTNNYAIQIQDHTLVYPASATNHHTVSIGQATLTSTSAYTITNSASLYIKDAPSEADGDLTVTNGAYALWVNAGVSRFDGGAIFNEGSADVDFRVESNGQTHAFFVDGSADSVGMGTDSPSAARLSLMHSNDTDYDDYKSNMGATAATHHHFNIQNTHNDDNSNQRYALMNFISGFGNTSMGQSVIGNVTTADRRGNFIIGTRGGSGAAEVVEKMRVGYSGNILIGGVAEHGTTVGTRAISLFDGTAPVGTLANGASFYSASGEMRVIDASGNATTLSPHDDDGQWVFHSKDTVTGEVLHIHMEKLMRRLNDEFGGGFIEEFIER